MGKVEKIVVLSVLFLIVLILAVSLTSKGTPRFPGDREDTLARFDEPQEDRSLVVDPGSLLAGGERGDAIGTSPVPRPGSGESPSAPAPDEPLVLEPEPPTEREEQGLAPGLLSSTVDRAARPREAAGPRSDAIAREADWDLRTTEGMRHTAVDSLLVYTCAADDTLAGLAQRFYGDRAKAQLLERNNEGVGRLSAGQEILVPVLDDSARAHEVQKDESLWAIAQRYYGDGTRWQDIFEANQHVLAQPTDLKPGMLLEIP